MSSPKKTDPKKKKADTPAASASSSQQQASSVATEESDKRPNATNATTSKPKKKLNIAEEITSLKQSLDELTTAMQNSHSELCYNLLSVLVDYSGSPAEVTQLNRRLEKLDEVNKMQLELLQSMEEMLAAD